jgi:hypothetical protein
MGSNGSGMARIRGAPAVTFKRCSCCGVEYSLQQWLKLPYVGVMRADPDQESLQLRNCDSCWSTLAVEVRHVGSEQSARPLV